MPPLRILNMPGAFAALLSGALTAAAQPGMNQHLFAWISLVPLLLAARDRSSRDGFVLGCVAGCVFHLGLIYWITVSMTVYGGVPWYAAGLLLLFFSLFLGVFAGAPLAVACSVRSRTGWGICVTFPLLWTACEYVKSWILTGFPWDNLAHSQFQQPAVIQIADATGVYGVSFLIVAVNCAVVGAVQHRGSRRYAAVAIAAVLLAAVLGYGRFRLGRTGAAEGGQALRVSMVQPNIPQDVKWDPDHLAATLEKFRELTAAARCSAPELVVWPESATPFFYEAEPAYQRVLREIAHGGAVHLLFGSPSLEQTPAGARFYNSAFLLSPAGAVVGKYDKIHLVPYGEYVPLQRLFPFIHRMVEGISDFSPGRAVRTLPLPGCTLGTVICYEIIFPDLVRRFAAAGAQAIVNITNDAWFGRTGAPVQHLAIAVFRAVENRRWIARCANTGITAFISPEGRITSRTDIFTETVLSGVLYCSQRHTLYTRFGDLFAQACLAAAVSMLIAGRKRRRTPPWKGACSYDQSMEGKDSGA